MADQAEISKLTEYTTDVVAAFVAHTTMAHSELPGLIASVHAAFVKLTTGAEKEPKLDLKPAVPIKKSVTPDAIICLEDGKSFKSLKRHLRTKYNLSPDEYRTKWGLPVDYPMVAPNYAERRSALAKTMGLGNQRKKVKAPVAQDVPAAQPAKKSRKKAA